MGLLMVSSSVLCVFDSAAVHRNSNNNSISNPRLRKVIAQIDMFLIDLLAVLGCGGHHESDHDCHLNYWIFIHQFHEHRT